jgi:putative glutamine amidotransferase
LFFFLLPFLVSFTPLQGQSIIVALSKASPNYIHWLKVDSTVTVIDLSNLTPAEAASRLHSCSALLLTGGGDINPALYKDADNGKVCQDIDQARDQLEEALIKEALALKMPVLGICRGEQILNVVTGGSLITDIPSFLKSKNEDIKSGSGVPAKPWKEVVVVHQSDDYLHCYHTVSLASNSLLKSILGSDTGFVTSNHHQAILRLGKGLKINAQSPDGIIEGIEWKNSQGKSFMLGVQWHPERMDPSNAFSGKLLQRFLAEARIYASKLQKGK